MTGAKPTLTGQPASARREIASRRLAGVEARGSMVRASPRSRVVMEIQAEARPDWPMGPRMSASRAISTDLVMMLNGCLNCCMTSRIERVESRVRSIG